MNILFCTVGRRGYIVDYFRKHLSADSKLIGTSDRNDRDTEFTSGFFHCDKSYIVPSIKEERKYIDELLNICKIEKIDMLLSFYDYDTYILSKYLKEFGVLGVKPVISSHEVNTICFDKVETFKFLKREGFKTPWTMTSEEVLETAIPSYPVIVKPRFGFGSHAISIANNENEVEFFLNYYNNEDMIVQEFMEGPEYGFDILNDFNGQTVTAVVKQKMKMRSGETDQGYAIRDSALFEWGMKLGRKLEHVGPLDVDFFIKDKSCYTVTEDKSSHLGVHYIVLKENNLANILQQMRIKIIGYLVFSFILMGIVGYFLGRLFLRPVREQIESLDNFISDTTHELNTPISAILMTIQSLKEVEPKKLKRLEASAKRLSVMYSSLTYRLEGNEAASEELCFANIVETRAEYVKELIESKRLSVNLDLDATRVYMPKESAHRLIDNLLSNAIKYSDVGDSITITLKDNIFKIKDTGIGIDEKVQEDIFKRYQRANEERGGFGIGLNIVLAICKQYKIKLGLESQKGEGSTFILTFPKIKN